MGTIINYSRSEVTKIIMLFLACLLGLVVHSGAHFVGDGPCPPFAPMQNFDAKKASGLWYEWARLDNPLESGSICTTGNFSLADDDTVTVTINSLLKYSGARISYEGKCSYENGSWSSGMYKCENPKTAVIRQSPIQYVLMTDYDHIKVTHTCVTTGDSYEQFFWVLSRTPDLDDKHRAEAADFLKKIHVSLNKMALVQQHDCN